MSLQEIEKVVFLDKRIEKLLSTSEIDQVRALFDEYRTTNEDDREAFVLALVTRLSLMQVRARLARMKSMESIHELSEH